MSAVAAILIFAALAGLAIYLYSRSKKQPANYYCVGLQHACAQGRAAALKYIAANGDAEDYNTMETASSCNAGYHEICGKKHFFIRGQSTSQ
jgi:hypothetical protein